MKFIYIDAVNSGISGDMFIAGLLDLIENPDIIIKKLEALSNYLAGVSRLEIELKKKKKSGILVNQIDINLKETKSHRNAHLLTRALNNFMKDNNIAELAINYANQVLNSLIQAEAEIHGKKMDKIHLHELSSVDTLLDICGTAILLDNLGYFNNNLRIYSSALPLGGGTINTAHGILPVPAPATLKILENSNLTVYNGPIDSELVTPTGAALLACLNVSTEKIQMNIEKTSYSMGQKQFKTFLNIMRIFYGELQESKAIDKKHPLEQYSEFVTLLETDVDDVSGEMLGNFIQKMEKEKILDVKIIPGITKKNRPSHTIRVMREPKHKFDIIERILDELGTLGVRMNRVERICVARKNKKIEIEIENNTYELNYKISYIKLEDAKNQIINIKPEFDDLKNISTQTGLSVKNIQFMARNQLERVIKNENLFFTNHL
jgi:hypothetical protein